jgi:hypothetical protein
MNNDNNFSSINDTLFVTNEMNQQKELYRWAPPKSLETRFGVELETCIRTTPECINFETDLLNAIPFATFKDKFDFYYKNIITKSKYFNALADEYKYLLVIDKYNRNGSHFYYDMQNPEELGKTEGEMLKSKFNEYEIDHMTGYSHMSLMLAEGISEIVKRGERYELPIFEDDLSIRCGDTTSQLSKTEASITDINSFRFECITPILSISGYPTKEKIKKVLLPMLYLFGLENPLCFIQNFSMGFHVNASLYNTASDKYVAIAEPPFLNKLLRNYIKVEKDIYKTVRTRKPLQSMDNDNYFTKFARPLHKNLNKFKTNSPELTENQIINTIMTGKDYINEKYKGLKRKSPFLLEFRLFEADNDIDRLITNTFVALDVLHKTANEVAKSERKLVQVDVRPINNNNGHNNNNRYHNNNTNSVYGGRKRTLKKKYRVKRHTYKRK